MTKDFDTNMPALPPGMSYYIGSDAVYKSTGYDSYLVFGVAVRESRETKPFWFWSKPKTKWSTRVSVECDRTPTAVRHAVSRAANKAWDSYHEREFAKRVTGNYPPNKLDNADGGL